MGMFYKTVNLKKCTWNNKYFQKTRKKDNIHKRQFYSKIHPKTGRQRVCQKAGIYQLWCITCDGRYIRQIIRTKQNLEVWNNPLHNADTKENKVTNQPQGKKIIGIKNKSHFLVLQENYGITPKKQYRKENPEMIKWNIRGQEMSYHCKI